MPDIQEQQPFTSKQIVSAQLVCVQLTETQTDGIEFSAKTLAPLSEAIYSDGELVFYSSPNGRTGIGYAVHHGKVRGTDDYEFLDPYYNAVADLKVYVDTAISVMANTLEAICSEYLIVVPKGKGLTLIPLTSITGAGSSWLEASAVYLDSHQDDLVLNTSVGILIAANMIACSNFEPEFLNGLSSEIQGAAAISGLYRRIAASAAAACVAYSNWVCQQPMAKVSLQMR